jgi:hypothetical protein
MPAPGSLVQRIAAVAERDAGRCRILRAGAASRQKPSWVHPGRLEDKARERPTGPCR